MAENEKREDPPAEGRKPVWPGKPIGTGYNVLILPTGQDKPKQKPKESCT